MSRWHTLGWFLLTLLLLWWLVWPSTQIVNELSRPNSEDVAGQGLGALDAWMRRSGIEVHSQRLRFSDMPDELESSTGNIAIVHIPGALFYEAEEVQALMEWVANGNTLLVSASYLEGPDWVYTGADIHRALWRLTGIGVRDYVAPEDETAEEQQKEQWQETLQDVVEDAQESLDDVLENRPETPAWMREQRAKKTLELRRLAPHRLTTGLPTLTVPWDNARWELVNRDDQFAGLALRAEARRKELAEIATEAEAEAETQETDTKAPSADEEQESASAVRKNLPWFDDMEACSASPESAPRQLSSRTGCIEIPTPAEPSWQTLLAHPDSDQPALLAAPLEQGEVLVLWHPSLLANSVVHRFENRQFAVRLVDTYLSATGAVVLDDAHQDLNSITDSEDLLSDPRLYITVGFLLLFWVAYLLAESGQWQRATRRLRDRVVGQMDLVTANANFMRNRMSPAATQELMLERLRSHLTRKWQLRRANALAEGLAREREWQPTVVQRLEDSLEKLGRGGKVAPLALQQQIDALLHVNANTNTSTNIQKDSD